MDLWVYVVGQPSVGDDHLFVRTLMIVNFDSTIHLSLPIITSN